LGDCATSTAGGERVERGKAAEIASRSCVHGIDGRSEVDYLSKLRRDSVGAESIGPQAGD